VAHLEIWLLIGVIVITWEAIMQVSMNISALTLGLIAPMRRVVVQRGIVSLSPIRMVLHRPRGLDSQVQLEWIVYSGSSRMLRRLVHGRVEPL